MRIPHVCFTVSLCLAAACGSERSGQDESAGRPCAPDV